jgi:hypothetical protein
VVVAGVTVTLVPVALLIGEEVLPELPTYH